ncbi:MAG: hypothetical protein Q8O39_00475 [bacterium]|nr:hypothetical protein [bacterium]
MPLTVRRKAKESVQSLIFQFTKAIRDSGILFGIRKKMFRHRPLNKRARKEKALRSLELKKQHEREEKLGLSVKKF